MNSRQAHQNTGESLGPRTTSQRRPTDPSPNTSQTRGHPQNCPRKNIIKFHNLIYSETQQLVISPDTAKAKKGNIYYYLQTY
jgi:hypothetical protein